MTARAGPALTWTEIDGRRETEVAAALGSARVFLSLSRAEGLGLTPLEAMASGCLVTGFTGGGGDEYASDENGLWVSHDDVDAATDALARACALADQAGPEMQLMIEAGARTAAQWSRGVFVEALGRYWDERLSSPP